METTVFNTKGKETGKITLPGLFETKVSSALLHEVVTGYLANQRAGTASTKSRGEVSGGGKKPWKQKGTGNARSGSNRSPLWRKGGIIFGPKPRDYYQRLPQQKRNRALQMALSIVARDGDLVVVEDIAVKEPKTKLVAEVLKNLKLSGNIVLVVAKADATLKRAARNIPGLVVTEAKNLNTYEVLWPEKIVATKSAIESMNVVAAAN